MYVYLGLVVVEYYTAININTGFSFHEKRRVGLSEDGGKILCGRSFPVENLFGKVFLLPSQFYYKYRWKNQHVVLDR